MQNFCGPLLPKSEIINSLIVQWFSNCYHQSSCISITRELVKNHKSTGPNPSLLNWIKNSGGEAQQQCFNKLPGNSDWEPEFENHIVNVWPRGENALLSSIPYPEKQNAIINNTSHKRTHKKLNFSFKHNGETTAHCLTKLDLNRKLLKL